MDWRSLYNIQHVERIGGIRNIGSWSWVVNKISETINQIVAATVANEQVRPSSATSTNPGRSPFGEQASRRRGRIKRPPGGGRSQPSLVYAICRLWFFSGKERMRCPVALK